MNLDWTHPIAVIVGILLGVALREWILAHRPPSRHEITIRFKEDSDACNPDRRSPDTE